MTTQLNNYQMKILFNCTNQIEKAHNMDCDKWILDGTMNVSLASCENYKTCDARWEEEEFFVEPDGTFYDYKYSEDE